MSFRATEFEFRNRVWFIAGIFAVAFMFYRFDPVNVSVALSRMIVAVGKQGNPHSIGACVRGFFAFGALLVISGALVRSWAEAYLHSSIVHDRDLHSGRLVADGPYRHLRNPLYLGTVLLAAGIGFLASRMGIIVLVGGMTLFTCRLILREEANLLAFQGESYRRYFQSVPRWLPSLTPKVPAAGGQPNWIDAFTGELFMWGCAAGMTLLAATENMHYFWTSLGIGFSIYFLQAVMRKKPPASSASDEH
jgi:protein-S-isoprenylcysteine O-methyltransferase Ste14